MHKYITHRVEYKNASEIGCDCSLEKVDIGSSLSVDWFFLIFFTKNCLFFIFCWNFVAMNILCFLNFVFCCFCIFLKFVVWLVCLCLLPMYCRHSKGTESSVLRVQFLSRGLQLISRYPYSTLWLLLLYQITTLCQIIAEITMKLDSIYQIMKLLFHITTIFPMIKLLFQITTTLLSTIIQPQSTKEIEYWGILEWMQQPLHYLVLIVRIFLLNIIMCENKRFKQIK